MNILIHRKIHTFLGLFSSAFLLILLVTGILLNHPDQLKGPEIRALAMGSSGAWYGAAEGSLWRSVDHGKNWEEVPMIFSLQEPVALAFDHSATPALYVLERWGKVYRAEVENWIWETLPFTTDLQAKGIECQSIQASANNVAVLTSHGIIFSTDGGTTWDISQLAQKPPLKKLIWSLHTGYFFGPHFVWLYDFAAAALAILIVSGFILWRWRKSQQ